jgi:hypothetical protein
MFVSNRARAHWIRVLFGITEKLSPNHGTGKHSTGCDLQVGGVVYSSATRGVPQQRTRVAAWPGSPFFDSFPGVRAFLFDPQTLEDMKGLAQPDRVSVD